ncbi:MAG: hypothetical protein AAGG53_08270 [Cyanobacteria bacterium P01_H01_bin.152]
MENLAHIEANLDNELAANADEYQLGAMTDETLEEMAAEMDREELADLANSIDEFLKLSDRAERETASSDLEETEAEKSKTLLTIQQQMVSIASDMGLVQFTPALYQRLYGKQPAQ